MLERFESGGECAVVGLGNSGVAATRLLRRGGVAVYASDSGSSPELEARAAELRALGAAVELKGHDLARIARAAGCVVSPGVPPEAPPIAAALAAGVPVIAEAQLGLDAMPEVRCLAVTGTNGKSTTTALAGHLLGHAGHRAIAAGNLGTPLCEIALEPVRPEWLAVELSSFQLHDMPGLRPAVGVLTNLAPDHLDRYPDLAHYYADKRRLFLNAGEESLWVVNADDRESLAMLEGVRGRKLGFSTRSRSDGWLDRKSGMLRLGDTALLPRGELPLIGDHNVANALAAALAVRAAGTDPALLAEGLRSFSGLPHRLEAVGEVDGVLWINDSKATTVASTAVAVQAMERPFVLLLGGHHKGVPYTELAGVLRAGCRAVIAYGEARQLILRDLAGAGVTLLEAGDDFERVLVRARVLARPGDAVLLSPACSSYDMFTNYEERGRRFREIVRAW